MKKMLDKNTFLRILKEEWRKEVRNLFEREEGDKGRPKDHHKDGEDKKKKDDPPVKLSPDSMDTTLVAGLTIKNEKGLEFKIVKVTDDYVMCDGNLSIPRTEEELKKYTLA